MLVGTTPVHITASGMSYAGTLSADPGPDWFPSLNALSWPEVWRCPHRHRVASRARDCATARATTWAPA